MAGINKFVAGAAERQRARDAYSAALLGHRVNAAALEVPIYEGWRRDALQCVLNDDDGLDPVTVLNLDLGRRRQI
ncbi:hypothetical protein [Bradyrhizobium sp. sBnM-33]|uniref:hypothetical protein n=1 Tax=Bradyrhizobium sp. sBnM-33 TaxID=2831780 RepID=UPI001BCE4B57|nr:hypothetical protein [Bradyrhizobium sp. sBnM-33]WOH52727.1 hypothetical protein RX328_11710 [Bradyrhizobium sp. sBnM-33]